MMPTARLVTLTAAILLIGSSCKLKLGNKPLRISDVVHHKILETAGLEKRNPPPRFYDPDLEGFVGEFLKDASDRQVAIPQDAIDKLRQIKYVDALSTAAEEGVIAACSRYFIEEKTLTGSSMSIKWTIIEVLRSATETFTESNRIRLRELMYHELFHCLMSKGHLPDGVEGIMSPTFAKGDRRAFTDWKKLVDDMFSQKFIDMIPDTE